MNLDLLQQNFIKTHILLFYRLTFIILLLISISSCNNSWKSYIVKAGNHSSNEIGLPIINVNQIEFKFKVDSSWYYSEPESPGWNKIRGFSNGHHQKNSSARLGYQCIDDSILVVGAYCYVNGVNPMDNSFQSGIIDTIYPGKIYHCKISLENDKYIFQFEDKHWEGPAGKAIDWGYLLNPYIGGVYTIDHDWHVKIKDLK
jgi:hypothetical protein